MNKHHLHFIAIILAPLVLMAVPFPSFAINCSSPPTNGWGAGYSAYAAWCSQCGGTPYNNNGVGCTPGPNWGNLGAGSGGGGGSSYGAAVGQLLGNAAWGIGQEIHKQLFGDPEEEAAEQARAELARRNAEAVEAARRAEAGRRRAEAARKLQEAYNHLSSQLWLSEGFDRQRDGLPLILGDDAGLGPQTPFFGEGANAPGSAAGANNDAKVVDLRPRQGYSAALAAPVIPGDSLPLILGDPDVASSPTSYTDANVVDLRDKKTPYVVDPNLVEGKPREIKMAVVVNVPPPTLPSADYVASQYVSLNPKEWPEKLRPLVEISDEALRVAQELARRGAEKGVDWAKDQTIYWVIDRLPGASAIRSLEPTAEEIKKTVPYVFKEASEVIDVVASPDSDDRGLIKEDSWRLENRGAAIMNTARNSALEEYHNKWFR